MQRCWRLVLVAFVALLFVNIPRIGSAADPPATGVLGLPYNENQTWPPAGESRPPCNSSGWQPVTLYHMQYDNAEPNPTNKYHMGEDWNGNRGTCGGDSDEGAPLLAIADGRVVYIDDHDEYRENPENEKKQGRGKQISIRHSFPYSKAPNGILTFDSVFVHIRSAVVAPGNTVTRGQEVARLGNTGGPWPPHLHWEMQWDMSLDVDVNPYQNPLTVAQALRYRAPSLFVDDRRDEYRFSFTSANQWFGFQMFANAPSSTAYIEYNGEKKSLKNAIAAGWISASGVNFWNGSGWRYYFDVDLNFFEKDKHYVIQTSIPGTVFHLPVPRSTDANQEDRARLDMLHAAENDPRFKNVRVETYKRLPDWSPEWELHQMAFELPDPADAKKMRVVYINQATNKTNRLARATTFFDPDTGQWTAWQYPDRNRLY